MSRNEKIWTEEEELELINRAVAERMKHMEEAQWQREAEMEFRRLQQEKRVNAALRMIAAIGLHTVMVAALVIMVKTGVLAGWLGLGSAAGIAVCGGFHAGCCWREFRM